jgi:hypothetical protein
MKVTMRNKAAKMNASLRNVSRLLTSSAFGVVQDNHVPNWTARTSGGRVPITGQNLQIGSV